MKCVLVSVVALLSLQAAVAIDANVGSPVERVVKLLETVKATTVSDGKAEQQIYDKYACWCETTTKRKADDIDQEDADLRSLGQRILKLKGTVATRTAEIAEATEEIQANEQEQESLTAVRQKQNGAWAAESDEVKQALAALQKAIKVLASATTLNQEGSALIQSTQMMQSKSAVNNVLAKLPSTVGLPPARMALLSEFVSSAAGYAPQSATIQGMLGDMYLTFAANLESDTSEEAGRNHDYEKLYASLEESNNQLKDTRDRKEVEKAEAEAMLADTTKNYEATEKQREADIEFFGETKKACLDKHAEWTERVKMRDSEIEGIDNALQILTSDKNRELFAGSIKPGVGFLQIASTPALLQESALAPAARAYNMVKAQAKKSHSFRFAALAVKIRSAKAGHFDKVIDDINLMLATLAKEGAADQDKKDQCLEEYQSIGKTVNDLDWKIKNNVAKIAKLQKLIEQRTEEKDDANAKIKETNQYIADITADRKAEHEAYNQAKKDDVQALKVLNSAKDAFAAFYKKQGIEMLQGEPAFERSEDDAPDASFTKKGSNTVASKNILQLMDYIIEDLTDELANTKKAETEAQADFEDEKAKADQLVSDLKDKVVGLENIIAKRITSKKEENVDKKENNKDRDDELTYKAKITPDCDWILKAFDQRAEARAAESAGLTTAKEFLAGKTALLQTFDDSKMKSINFLGLA
jgi:septal ring factor EnvC (AmiA/AmiB activator)